MSVSSSLNSVLAAYPVLVVFPLIFHSIPEEIPDASQPLITRLYQLWLVLLGTLILNMIACIFILIAGSSDGGRDVGASIGSAQLSVHVIATHFRLRYLFTISALSFLLWYRCVTLCTLSMLCLTLGQTHIQWIYEGVHALLVFMLPV